MPTRLTPVEQTTLALDTTRTPAIVGSVDVFDPGPEGFDYDRLIDLVRERIGYAPRYRQRVLGVPGRLAGPVWADDSDFDLTFHVRRAALPKPGSHRQLDEFAAGVLSRRLDRTRPLWELYLVEGLEHDRIALVSKTHPCLIDGVDTVALEQVLLDNAPDEPAGVTDSWHPLPEPGPFELITGALTEGVRDPARPVSNLQHALTDAFGVAVAASEVAGFGGQGGIAADALLGTRAPHRTPLAGSVSEQRRVAVLSADLDDVGRIGAEHEQTIHDVLVAVIAGGLRSWLLTRGEEVGPEAALTAWVPMSVTGEDGSPTSVGSTVESLLVRLPIGEPDALIRLHQVADATWAHRASGRAVPAQEIAAIPGFAPPTVHALGVRTVADLVRRPYDVVITNVPGPQAPVYLNGAPMVESFPVIPLASGHRLSIGATSYQDKILIGLNADRDAISDVDVLAQCLSDALAELLDAAAPGRA